MSPGTRRLLYIANARIPTEKAHGVQVLQMCDAFCRTGLRTELLVPFRVQARGAPPVNVQDFYGLKTDVRVRQLPVPDFLPLMRRLGRSERVAFQCQSVLFAIAAGMVARVQGGPCYTRDASVGQVLDRLGVPFILEQHVYPERPGTLRRILKMSVGRSMRRLVVVTGGLKSAYAMSGVPEDRILVLPDGVRPDLFDIAVSQEQARSTLGLPVEGKLVGYVGRFHTMGEEKGIAELLRSYQYLPEDLRRITRIVLVGGPLEAAQAYRALLETEGLPGGAYIFLGSLPYAQIPLALKALDVAVIPYPWTTHYAYYASPLKLYEYMAAGVPVVATDMPSLREILEDGVNAVLVPPGDPVGLAGGVQRLLESEELGSRLTAAAKARIRECSWDARAERIRGILEEGDSVGGPGRRLSCGGHACG